ncbi:MAG: helix-turn-helix transcriptional regulator [Ruminococcaceae bacterium]|nr:helix-turn-helix transcriptional regulator [Oscillospiraceae bacterium]
MNDIKATVAKNIARLRLSHQMTQLELAEKINYSDKAVSKWEHGDSMPDISVLVHIADVFGVTLDELIHEEGERSAPNFQAPKTISYRRSVIICIAVIGVWALALLAFVLVSLIAPGTKHQWLSFIYALPLSSIVWLVLNSIWLNKKMNFVIISILMWTVLLSVHLSLLLFSIRSSLIYLLGIPGQMIIFLCAFIRKNTKS